MTPLRLERAISLFSPLIWVLITPTPPKGHKTGCVSAYRPALCVHVCACACTPCTQIACQITAITIAVNTYYLYNAPGNVHRVPGRREMLLSPF